MHSHRIMITFQGVMIKMSQIIKDMKVIDTSIGSTIVVEDLEVENDFLEIVTIDHDNPSSDLHVIKKDTATQTSHTKIELI